LPHLFKVTAGERDRRLVRGLDHGLGGENNTLRHGNVPVKRHVVDGHVAVGQAAALCLEHDLKSERINPGKIN
jgi:hypothetical protein